MSTTISLLREQLQQSHQFLESTIAGSTPEQAHWVPPGNAHPIGATYVHAIMAEDIVINIALKGGAPLFATTWAGKTGFSEPMPMPGPDWKDYAQWARRVRVDLPEMQAYTQAVYAATVITCLHSPPKILTRRSIFPTWAWGRSHAHGYSVG